jgi:hypothetical protein
MPDYNNGKIYKLWSPQGDDIYIGSTTQSLSIRKAEHKRNYINDSVCSSKILFQKYDDVRIELIEQFSCKNKQQLNKREGHYIRALVCVNRCVAGRTQKEYREDNKEYYKEYDKQYRENNKEYLKEYHKEYNKEYYEKNKEKLREWYEDNKEKIKEHNQNKKEEIKEYNKQYRENNKKKILEINKKYREANRDKINQRSRERDAKKKNLVSVQSPV